MPFDIPTLKQSFLLHGNIFYFYHTYFFRGLRYGIPRTDRIHQERFNSRDNRY